MKKRGLSGFRWLLAVAACALAAQVFAAGNMGGAFVAGWNLSGNSTERAIDPVATFGTSAAPVAGVTSSLVAVWKWNTASRKWQIFTPALDAAALATFAARRGMEVLATIAGGEAYWIYAAAPFSLPAPQDGDGSHTVTAADLVSGWNMVVTADAVAPKDFNATLQNSFAMLPPSPGSQQTSVQTGLVSLWAWDSASKNWYFYAPAFDGNDAMKSRFLSRTGLLDFGAAGKTLGPGVGFWVSMP